MKAVKANIPRALPVGAYMDTCDNSGAKKIKITAAFGHKTVKGKYPAAGVGDLVAVTVKKGKPDIRKTVVFGVIVRQKKEYRRPDGTRIKFEDNSIVIVKDKKGNPKGTIFKGPIAKEVVERWPAIGKVANMVV